MKELTNDDCIQGVTTKEDVKFVSSPCMICLMHQKYARTSYPLGRISQQIVDIF